MLLFSSKRTIIAHRNNHTLYQIIKLNTNLEGPNFEWLKFQIN